MVCTLFNMIVRLADSLGWDVPEWEAFTQRAPAMLEGGYALSRRGQVLCQDTVRSCIRAPQVPNVAVQDLTAGNYAQAACTSSSPDPSACSSDTITLTGLTPPILVAVGARAKPWGGVGASGMTTVG